MGPQEHQTPDDVSPSYLHNAIAGLSVAGLLIPEAIAYAGIAGVAPQHAVVSSVAGLLAYAALGGSRYAIVSPTSSSATILAAAVATLVAAGFNTASVLMLSSAMVLLVGVLFALSAAARIGHLAAFISRPVLRGFAFGLAVTIVIKQLPHIAGVAAHGTSAPQALWQLLQDMPTWNPWTLGLGCGAYICLQLLKRIALFPAAFAVMLLGMAAAALLDLPAHGVPLVGAIDMGHIHLAWPALDRNAWLRVAELAVPLVVILYAESWGSIRTLALKHNDVVEPNRELAALGAANLASGIFQGLPVGAGFSASSANEDAGAQGKSAGLLAALVIFVLMLLAGPWLALLPQPVLAAVVVSALTHALNPRPLLTLWRLGRDEVLALCAVLAVIALGVLQGMLLAVLLSIVAAVRRFSQARVSVLGELPGTHDFIEAARHPEARLHPGVLVVRPEAPLFFANAEQILAEVRRLAEAQPAPLTIVLSLEESTDLDSTAVETLAEFHGWALRTGHRLLLARVKESVRELLLRGPAPSADTACFWSVADAVQAAMDKKGR
jgi:MFS superfamily sulfate permease-like transporter